MLDTLVRHFGRPQQHHSPQSHIVVWSTTWDASGLLRVDVWKVSFTCCDRAALQTTPQEISSRAPACTTLANEHSLLAFVRFAPAACPALYLAPPGSITALPADSAVASLSYSHACWGYIVLTYEPIRCQTGSAAMLTRRLVLVHAWQLTPATLLLLCINWHQLEKMAGAYFLPPMHAPKYAFAWFCMHVHNISESLQTRGISK